MELFHANRQWASRPVDERFDSIESLYRATKAYGEVAREKTDVKFGDIRVENQNEDVVLTGRANVPAKLSHYAFGQLCARVGAPAQYLRDLPAGMAVSNLNHGLAVRSNASDTRDCRLNLLFHQNDGLLLRAVTSDKYARIWNWEVAGRLRDLGAKGWEPARPDIRQSMGDYPALYASDHDMFAFLRNSTLTVSERGSDGAVYKGVIVENSEVGASALKMTRFLYREMCGNHIIWGASRVLEISVRHVGDARARWGSYSAQLRAYADESVSDVEGKIAKSKTVSLGSDKEHVLDTLFGKRIAGLSRKTIEQGYDACLPDQDGAPTTQWGIVQGLTRFSQTLPYADKRTEIDRAAGKVLEATF